MGFPMILASPSTPGPTRIAARDLTPNVARSVDRFLEENVSDDDARAWLDRTVPGIDGAGEATAALALDAARCSAAKQRSSSWRRWC